MKSHWLLVALFFALPLYAWQGTTPQAALEELATATKPEVIARHLPEPVQKRIEVLPKITKATGNGIAPGNENDAAGRVLRPACPRFRGLGNS
jgi:hypothetical protein